MTASGTSHKDANANLNHLVRGRIYRASTRYGTTIGEYLGMETPYGNRAILLRHRAGTVSIRRRDIESIQPTVAA